MRPVIGITGPEKGGGPAYFFSALQVLLAGGIPKRVHPGKNWKHIEVEGLIIGGGADISPERYNQQREEKWSDELSSSNGFFKRILQWSLGLFTLTLRKIFGYSSSRGKIDLERDEMEFYLLDQAVKTKKPVLGICRGMQLINLYRGGTLNQSIDSFYTETPQIRTVFPKKKVEIIKETLLAKILKKRFLKVNALHDQSIKELGSDLKICARERNGIVQAIESLSDNSRILGVQWHPEFLIYEKSAQMLFQWMVKHSEVSSRCHSGENKYAESIQKR